MSWEASIECWVDSRKNAQLCLARFPGEITTWAESRMKIALKYKDHLTVEKGHM